MPIEHAYINIIAGVCYSLGLKFAGTFHLPAKKVISHYLDYFMELHSCPGMFVFFFLVSV